MHVQTIRRDFENACGKVPEKGTLAWLAQAGIPIMGSVEVLETDLSTVTTAADKVLLVHKPEHRIIHIELQSSRDVGLHRRLLLYNVLLYDRYGLPVHTILVLLRPEAKTSALPRRVGYASPFGNSTLEFSYQVVCIWQQPVDMFLNGELRVLPLAPVSNISQEELPSILRQVSDRLDREASPAEAETLWTATYILAGLRYPASVVTQLFAGVRDMTESSTYQAILEEGVLKGVKHLLLVQGEARFGTPSAQIQRAIETITDANKLDQMGKLLLIASTWDELLAS